MSRGQPMLRLAVRQEGATIQAYAARLNTMDDALTLGSIATGVCEADRSVFDAWVKVMSSALAALLATQGVTVTEFEQRDAPQHERAGNA